MHRLKVEIRIAYDYLLKDIRYNNRIYDPFRAIIQNLADD